VLTALLVVSIWLLEPTGIPRNFLLSSIFPNPTDAHGSLFQTCRGFGPKPKLFIMSPSEQYRALIAEHITAWNRSGIVDSLLYDVICNFRFFLNEEQIIHQKFLRSLARANFRRDNPIVIPTACGVPLGLSRLKVAVVSVSNFTD
jgi:hypothetical protein